MVVLLLPTSHDAPRASGRSLILKQRRRKMGDHTRSDIRVATDGGWAAADGVQRRLEGDRRRLEGNRRRLGSCFGRLPMALLRPKTKTGEQRSTP